MQIDKQPKPSKSAGKIHTNSSRGTNQKLQINLKMGQSNGVQLKQHLNTGQQKRGS